MARLSFVFAWFVIGALLAMPSRAMAQAAVGVYGNLNREVRISQPDFRGQSYCAMNGIALLGWQTVQGTQFVVPDSGTLWVDPNWAEAKGRPVIGEGWIKYDLNTFRPGPYSLGPFKARIPGGTQRHSRFFGIPVPKFLGGNRKVATKVSEEISIMVVSIRDSRGNIHEDFLKRNDKGEEEIDIKNVVLHLVNEGTGGKPLIPDWRDGDLLLRRVARAQKQALELQKAAEAMAASSGAPSAPGGTVLSVPVQPGAVQIAPGAVIQQLPGMQQVVPTPAVPTPPAPDPTEERRPAPAVGLRDASTIPPDRGAVELIDAETLKLRQQASTFPGGSLIVPVGQPPATPTPVQRPTPAPQPVEPAAPAPAPRPTPPSAPTLPPPTALPQDEIVITSKGDGEYHLTVFWWQAGKPLGSTEQISVKGRKAFPVRAGADAFDLMLWDSRVNEWVRVLAKGEARAFPAPKGGRMTLDLDFIAR